MRQYKLFLTLMILASLAFAAVSCGGGGKKGTEGSEGKAAIALDSTSTNLGTFPKSQSLRTTVFTFTNKGDAPLEFLGAEGNCTCIWATYPKKPVKPGKKGEIIVTYRGSNKDPGKFHNKVYFAVTGWPENFVLHVSGVMTEN